MALAETQAEKAERAKTNQTAGANNLDRTTLRPRDKVALKCQLQSKRTTHKCGAMIKIDHIHSCLQHREAMSKL